LQSKFKQAIAAAGGVPLGNVIIDQIQALERRAGNTRVDFKVIASNVPAAESISKALTLDRINYELTKRGLVKASMLEASSVFSTKAQNQIQLGQAGIVGIAVGGSVLLLALGICFYCGYCAQPGNRYSRRSPHKEPQIPSTVTRTQERQKKLQSPLIRKETPLQEQSVVGCERASERERERERGKGGGKEGGWVGILGGWGERGGEREGGREGGRDGVEKQKTRLTPKLDSMEPEEDSSRPHVCTTNVAAIFEERRLHSSTPHVFRFVEAEFWLDSRPCDPLPPAHMEHDEITGLQV
jgi:hypothetical protein